MKYITDREEIAKVMNFGKFPVIRINLETCKRGYNDFYEGDILKVMAPSLRYLDMYVTGKIYYSEGRFGVMTDSCCLHSSFGYGDVMEQLAIAQAPVIHAGETVVLIEDYPVQGVCKVRIMKASDRVNANVYPCVTFSDVPDDWIFYLG